MALLFGWRRIIPTVAMVLLLQALLFAHGGLTTLGANILTLGAVGPLVALAVARGLIRLRVPALWATGVACLLGDAAVYLADAAIVASALHPHAFITTFAKITVALSPAQIPLAVLEGLVSAALLSAVVVRAPSLTPTWLRPTSSGTKTLAFSALLLALPTPSQAAETQSFPGLDETVFGAHAREAGQTVGPVFDLEGGELGRALFGAGMLTAGFAAGLGWARLCASRDGHGRNVPKVADDVPRPKPS
jgi:cobalt/nickel transport system permease protein